MSRIDRFKKVLDDVVKEIGNEKNLSCEEVLAQVSELSSYLKKTNDNEFSEYLSDLSATLHETDSIKAFRRKIWRVFLRTNNISVTADIIFDSTLTPEEYDGHLRSISSKIDMRWCQEKSLFHFLIHESQESRFREELTCILKKLGLEEKVTIQYIHSVNDAMKR